MPEPDRFPYSPLPERPRLKWPDGARVALWVLPNIEHYEYQPALINVRDPWPRTPHPDVLNYGLRDYGNRVGVWRMFDCLNRHNIRATISLNFGIIEHYPDIWEAMEARQYDYLCHGLYNTRYLWDLSEDETREAIRDCVDILRKANGSQLNGWFGPADLLRRSIRNVMFISAIDATGLICLPTSKCLKRILDLKGSAFISLFDPADTPVSSRRGRRRPAVGTRPGSQMCWPAHE